MTSAINWSAQFATLDDLARRKAYVREVMTRDVGGFPERTPLNPRITGVLDRGDYVIEKVIFESQPHFYVTANLYLPKTGQPPYPAVLYPLGHELGAKSHSAWQQMLGSLAKKGYVALAWDPIGQGERIQIYDHDFEDSKGARVHNRAHRAGHSVLAHWRSPRSLHHLGRHARAGLSAVAAGGRCQARGLHR